eukprot:TRINITY_DN1726_c1_g2_i2.p1 TRINITY_DN1726_c1_g2~~TRINITY_DN1726_c1_g2_i2.p1  ORF type:complete len:903 (-),score=265.49 TRINITY_DN1726_c1_g2_i2:5132-7840(-)
MIGWLRRLRTERRLAREEEALRHLKAQYHTLRAVLHCNERAMELISTFDEALLKHSDLGTNLEELLAVVFELIDGLNRLSDNRYAALYGVYDNLASRVREITRRLTSDDQSGTLSMMLSECDASHANIIGGKAAFLGELLRAGAPVPAGFAMTTHAARYFLIHSGVDEEIRRLLRPLEAGGRDVAEVAGDIQRIILNASLPAELIAALEDGWKALGKPPVSVRSSALVEDNPEHSFAGQFSSILNITDGAGLMEAYKRVVASNFGPRPFSYRLQAGLPLTDFSMGVIVQAMVDARAAGVLFTLNPSEPENERMLISAVAGLGTQAVGGSAPADVYQPLRSNPHDVEQTLAAKSMREVAVAAGGLSLSEVPEDERDKALLDQNDMAELMRWGRLGEVLFGAPQDMEWAMDAHNRLFILQSRSIRLQGKAIRAAARLRGERLITDGVCASSGRSYGKTGLIHAAADLARPLPEGPVVLVLQQSLVDAAQLMPRLEGVVVELGNPTDHLSCVAREFGVPMITGATGALEAIPEDILVVVDADDHLVLEAPDEIEDIMAHTSPRKSPQARISSEVAALREMIVPLNLTDAYGPTFSIQECKSLHDIVRFSHEKALISLFHAGDEVLDEAGSLVHWIDDVPLHFLVIDLGGGLQSGLGRKITLDNVLCAPLLALCDGMNTEGLRWRKPPPGLSTAGLVSRALLDKSGERPVGNQNYALVTRDYLNLNARVDYHFAMVDSVCGPNRQENYIRFRFKGGGTTSTQRERRALFIAEILRAHGFFTDCQADLVTGSVSEMPAELIREDLAMLGRLLGFSRLMDGAMTSEDAPHQAAEAFLHGDWSLEGMENSAKEQSQRQLGCNPASTSEPINRFRCCSDPADTRELRRIARPRKRPACLPGQGILRGKRS